MKKRVASDALAGQMIVLILVNAAHFTDLHVLLILHHILSDLVRELVRIHPGHEIGPPLIDALMPIARSLILVTLSRQRALDRAHLIIVTEGLKFNVSALLNMLEARMADAYGRHAFSSLTLILDLFIVEENYSLRVGRRHGLGRHRHDLIVLILVKTFEADAAALARKEVVLA